MTRSLGSDDSSTGLPIVVVTSNQDNSEPCHGDCNDVNSYMLVSDSSLISYNTNTNNNNNNNDTIQNQQSLSSTIPYNHHQGSKTVPFQPNATSRLQSNINNNINMNNTNPQRAFYHVQVPGQKQQQQQQQQNQHQHQHYALHDNDAESISSYKTVRFTTTGVEPVDFVYFVKSRFGDVLRNEYFNALIVIVILLNAILMGIGTLPSIANNPRKTAIFDNIDFGFLILFTIEVSMQLFYRGCGFFSDGWLIFDLFVICSSWILSPLQIIRVFRIFRVIRLIPQVHELTDIISVVTTSMPKFVAIFVLLQLQYYIFAVMFTQLFGNAYTHSVTSNDYFSTLDKTYFTLFQLMTLDNWSNITRELMKAYRWAWVPMILYVLSTTFIILNLIIAVLCASMQIISNKQNNEKQLLSDIKSRTADTPKMSNQQQQQQQQQSQSSLPSSFPTESHSTTNNNNFTNDRTTTMLVNDINRLGQKVDTLTRVIQQLILVENDPFLNERSVQSPKQQPPAPSSSSTAASLRRQALQTKYDTHVYT